MISILPNHHHLDHHHQTSTLTPMVPQAVTSSQLCRGSLYQKVPHFLLALLFPLLFTFPVIFYLLSPLFLHLLFETVPSPMKDLSLKKISSQYNFGNLVIYLYFILSFLYHFPSLSQFLSGHAFILVYSISSRQSLEELKPILELIGEVSENEHYYELDL